MPDFIFLYVSLKVIVQASAYMGHSFISRSALYDWINQYTAV